VGKNSPIGTQNTPFLNHAEFLLNKLATVYIGAVGLGRQIKELEEKVNAMQDKT